MADFFMPLRRMMMFILLAGINTGSLIGIAPHHGINPQQFKSADATISLLGVTADIPDTYDLVAENDLFQLYVNRAALTFKVVDKRSGYIWSSNLDEVEKTDKLNSTWRAFAQSGVSIDYLDQKALYNRVSIINGNITLDYTPVDQGVEATVKFADPSITLSVIIKLEAAGVSVEVPFSSIKEESPDFKLGILHLFPFFGATRADSIPGYMFIPDGSGSLIPFASETRATNMYYGKYYGPDLGMIADLQYNQFYVSQYKVSFPVIGMVHEEGQNAYICILEKGASYGEIQAHPSGLTTNFNFLYNAFTYNESYFQATSRSGDGVTTLQAITNDFDIRMHYRFLTASEADYVGMARNYQKYLVDKGDLKVVEDQDSDIGIRLEFLGGDWEKVLVWKRMIPMTTVAQMDTILQDLGINNVDVIYYGWQPLGASYMPPASLHLDGSLGDTSQLKALVQKIKTGGGRFSLYLDPQAALLGVGGYSPRSDLAMSITNVNLLGYNRNNMNYYRNLSSLNKFYLSLSQDVFTKLDSGLALDGIGSMLYSDFKRKHLLNREQAIDSYQELLAQNNGNLSFYIPNDYMYQFMNAYYDMPLSDSGFLYTSESVPFLQIVLAGYVPFYGPALNFTSNIQQDLLRLADYDVYPSFFLSNDVTAKILDTSLNWVYSSSYEQWGQTIKESYQWLDSLLGPVKGQEIVSRLEIGDQVFTTIYAKGKQIIVNYNESPFLYEGNIIPGQDAMIIEVLP